MYGWTRYLYIEQEFLAVKQYLPYEFEDVYSEFFTRAVILLGAEIEGTFKVLCKNVETPDAGNMEQYKNTILTNYPGIVNWKCLVRENEKKITPFEGWNLGKLDWWDVYTGVKHNLVDKCATYKIALKMLGAYELLIFIIAATDSQNIKNTDSDGCVKPIKAYSILDSPKVLVVDMDLGIGDDEADVTNLSFYPNDVLEHIV